jgi:MFS family permease
VAFIRPIERLGKGFRDAPRDAIVSESVPSEHRGKAFGIQRAMDSAGAILGSVAVLVLFVYLDIPFRTIFLISACIGLVAALPVLAVRVPPIFRKIAVATVFSLANFSVAFFILRSQSSSPDLPFKEAIGLSLLAYIVFNVVDTVFSGPAGALSDRIGRRRTILIGYGLFVAVCAGFASFSSAVSLIALFAVYGLFKAFVDASQRAFVSDLSPAEVRGTALGAFEAATGLAAIPAGLIAGVLWSVAPAWTFVYGALVALFASGLLFTAVRGDIR